MRCVSNPSISGIYDPKVEREEREIGKNGAQIPEILESIIPEFRE